MANSEVHTRRDKQLAPKRLLDKNSVDYFLDAIDRRGDLRGRLLFLFRLREPAQLQLPFERLDLDIRQIATAAEKLDIHFCRDNHIVKVLARAFAHRRLTSS